MLDGVHDDAAHACMPAYHWQSGVEEWAGDLGYHDCPPLTGAHQRHFQPLPLWRSVLSCAPVEKWDTLGPNSHRWGPVWVWATL